MATDLFTRLREAVSRSEWQDVLDCLVEASEASLPVSQRTGFVEVLTGKRVVEAACEWAVQQDKSDRLVELRGRLRDGEALCSLLSKDTNGKSYPPWWRFTVSCALAATYAQRNLAGATADALWEAACNLARRPEPSPAADGAHHDARALLDGDSDLELVRRICRNIRERLGEDGWVAAHILHMVRYFTAGDDETPRAQGLTGLLVRTSGGAYHLGSVCRFGCAPVEEGLQEIVPDGARTPPLGSEFLAGLRTAREYLRSQVDEGRQPVWGEGTDLCLSLTSTKKGASLPPVDGRSMTALVATVGENLLREGPPLDLSCSISADLVCEHGEWKLGPVEGIRDKVFAASQEGLRTLVVCPESEHEAQRAAEESHNRLVADHENRGGGPRPVLVEIIPCRTVQEARTVLTREPQALLAYLDVVRDRMVQLIPPLFIPRPWQGKFFKKLYQPLQVRFIEKRLVEQPPGPDGERQPPREEWVEVRQSWDEYREEKLRAGTRRFEIEADGGHGKSTLLQFMTWKRATEAAEAIDARRSEIRDLDIPFFFRCSELESEEPLHDVMMDKIAEMCSLDDHGLKLLREILTSNRAVICWDAMDETGNANGLAGRMADFAARYPEPEIYLTCRSKQFPEIKWPPNSAQRIELAPFDADTVGQFAMTWADMLEGQDR